eukprot:CAMPEP_0116554848 /NCGR_PEP_ID=MMETSP0397-20121206/7812_1 /TAXON_ID=216820 /ORGANISM="Cyclophora tenuis, Strain ECT3854" /LENGTH=166 /DNA_ID=CAMNT_0004080039 /DNA_START=30 /DNA_END=531 /DNA_ORIENTATION=+
MIEGKMTYESFMDDPTRLLVPTTARKDFGVLRARVRQIPTSSKKDVRKDFAKHRSQGDTKERSGSSSLHLTAVQKELANLFVMAREQKKTWEFIETTASASLKQYIQKKSKHHTYLETPLRCLIPRKLTVAFHSYCADILRSMDGKVSASVPSKNQDVEEADSGEE